MTDKFNQHIENFKAHHKLTPCKHGPAVQPGDGQVPKGFKLMEEMLGGILHATVYIYDYGLDTPYRICSVLDPILQYVAFDGETERFIFWNEDQPDGIHPAESMARIFELDGIEVECEVDESGNSSTVLYHGGKITRITDNHNSADRQITVDGKDLSPIVSQFSDEKFEDWYESAISGWDEEIEDSSGNSILDRDTEDDHDFD